MSNAGSVVSRAADIVGDPGAFIADKFAAKTQTVLYLYLINEVTHKPVIPTDPESPYPLVITKPTQFVAKFMPLMKVGLEALTVFNGVPGLAQCARSLCLSATLPSYQIQNRFFLQVPEGFTTSQRNTICSPSLSIPLSLPLPLSRSTLNSQLPNPNSQLKYG